MYKYMRKIIKGRGTIKPDENNMTDPKETGRRETGLTNIVDKLQDNADPFLVNNKKFTRQANRSFRENRGACIFCGDKTHSAKNCKLDLTTAEKRQLAFDAGVCTGCYQQGHIFRNCRSAERCSQCNGSHKLVDCPSKQSKSNWTVRL